MGLNAEWRAINFEMMFQNVLKENISLKEQQLADKEKLQSLQELQKKYSDVCGQLNAAWYNMSSNSAVDKMKKERQSLQYDVENLRIENESLKNDLAKEKEGYIKICNQIGGLCYDGFLVNAYSNSWLMRRMIDTKPEDIQRCLETGIKEYSAHCFTEGSLDYFIFKYICSQDNISVKNLMKENDNLQEQCGSFQVEMARLRKLVLEQSSRDTTATYESCQSTHVPSDPVETLFAACGTPVKMVTMDDVMAEIDYNDVDCSDCEEVNAYIARNDELDALNEDALFTIDAMNDDLAAIRDVLGIGDEDSIIDSVKSLKNSFYVIRMALGIGEEESIVSAAKHMLATIQKNPFRVEWAHSSPPLKGTGFLR